MRKTSIFLITLSLLLLTSCSKDLGSIAKNKDIKIIPGHYAGVEFSKPKNWNKEGEGKSYTYTDPKTGSEIFVEHSFTNSTEVSDIKLFLDSFDNTINNFVFTCGTNVAYSKKANQNATKSNVICQTSDKTIISREYDDLKVTTSSDSQTGLISSKIYYIRYKGIDTVIMMVCPIENKAEMYAVADSFVNGMKDTEETTKKGYRINKKNLPAVFNKKRVSTSFGNGNCYYVDCDTFYAGCFVYEYTTSDHIDLDEITAKEILLDTYNTNTVVSICDDNKYLQDVDAYKSSVVCTILDGNETYNSGTVVKIESYEFNNKIIIIGYPILKSEYVKFFI